MDMASGKQLYAEMCSELFPVFKKFFNCEKYAITLGGSHGKGLADINSDFDFRVYYETAVEKEKLPAVIVELDGLINDWKKKGMLIDSVWTRSFDEVDKQLESCLSGNCELVSYEWSVWGYSILTDIFHQQIIEDPFDIAKQWKDRLSVYPKALKSSIIKKHLWNLRFRKSDYHYKNKVKREDGVFLASLTAKLINDIIQVIYALNEFYYPGDGLNLEYTPQFKLKPENFEEKVIEILYPDKNGEIYQNQYNNMIRLIDDVLKLI